jgi:glycosidase
MEFHIQGNIRRQCGFDETLFASSGNVIFANFKAVQLFAQKYNKTIDGTGHPEHYLKTGQLNAMGLIDEILHYVCRLYRRDVKADFFMGMAETIEKKIGADGLRELLETFTEEFPPRAVYRDRMPVSDWLLGADSDGTPHKLIALEELILLKLANENPAFEPFFRLFSDKTLAKNVNYAKAWDAIRSWSVKNPPYGPEGYDLISMLKAPVDYSPYDLKGQLDYIRTRWQTFLGEWLSRLLSGIDLIAEEEKAGWSGGVGGGNPEMDAYEFGDISKEYERFSPDRDWMPNVVLMAKSALVWLSQLSEKYGRPITRLDQIPDEELDFLASAGFTGLWLIGLWERSMASARIKQICGNPEAAASAYSLDDYDIAEELGGWDALNNLRTRAWKRGIRMASDMVPNHTGMDSRWVVERPDLFVQTRDCPFPGYDFNGENLSHDGRVGLYLENHYYSKSDCAVVFKRVDNYTGDTRYIYHGNDGTGMPWNDTAQIDFLNPEAREEVIQKILHVARNFPIIRFDAAMVLAKKHIQRLWYPEPGKGGDIASRSRFAISRDEFEKRIPEEFWREVVDRCAKEIPDTLLLAEAFWMMEGYFVRTLGMHRVYNSAFMNMLKREDNEKYRTTIKNTIEFDPEILKRYVNFMNNPDEETAVAQFGRGDKYFGVCTMMVAMPGLPMFGHGQVEGFEEKYGMEYRRAYRNEQVDDGLVARHRHEIFPLMKKRWLFAGVENFRLYDFWENGRVNENVFVWSNRVGTERAIIFYNNKYEQATGWIKMSAASLEKKSDGAKELVQRSVTEALALTPRDGRFCIMQEQRSGLWYIRTTHEIAERGLFAHLDGFQTQVFINIHEVDDNAEGHYRTLYDALGGRGIDDIQMGIKNIVLKDLYGALAAFTSREYFDCIRKLTDAFTAPATASKAASAAPASAAAKTVPTDAEIAAFIAKTEPAARKFFGTVQNFLDADYGADAISGMDKRAAKPDFDETWTRFATALERLVRLPSITPKNRDGFLPESAKLADGINAFIRQEAGMEETLGAVIAIYAIRDIVGAKVPGAAIRSLVDLWSLDRKEAEFLAEAGIDARRSSGTFREIKELFILANTESFAKKDRIDHIVTTLLSEESAAPILGIHEWDSIRWFNKEAAEKMLSYALTLIAIAGRPEARAGKPANLAGDWNELLASLSVVKKTVLVSFEASGYQTEKLFALHAPAKLLPHAAKVKAKASEKPAAAKKTASAAASKKVVKPAKPSGAKGKSSDKPSK